MDAVEDPIKKARMVVMAQGGHMISLPKPTKEQIALAYQDCFNEIVKGEVDETYIDSIRHSILSYPATEDHRYGEKDAVEQLLSLASRLVKGKHCEECRMDFKSPTRGWRGSDGLHRELSRAIHRIVEDSTEGTLGWSLSLKMKFALNKLNHIYPGHYRSLETLIDSSPQSVIYETMWCHENVHPDAGYGKDDKGEHKMVCKC